MASYLSKLSPIRIPGIRMVVAVLTILGISSVPASASRTQHRAPTVRIDAGELEGVPLLSLAHGAAFLGIPYAAQPVGDLRWKSPRPHPKWNGVRRAAAYGPACPQAPSPWLPEMLGRSRMMTDEACLYLNVWTPELTRGAKLPVLVWIHGGGNVEGSGEWPPLGETLAHTGIVVVSINYRLGIFGFFASPELSAESPRHVSGNYGQLDQLAALNWVRRNIGRFGGDPDQVTVAGASSGSLDVCNLMASPLSSGLFQRAVLQSGVCVDSIFPSSRQAETSDSSFAKELGSTTAPLSLAELRSIPAERVLDAAAKDRKLDLEPAIDGWFLQEQPAAIFAHGKQSRVPVLVGSNENEVSIFASPLVGGRSYRPGTIPEYRQWLSKRFGVLADQVFAVYPAHDDSDVVAAFTTMDTDFDFGFGARLLAQESAQNGQHAFLYHFTYTGKQEFATLGAFHSEESMFLSKRYWTSWISTPGDEQLANAILTYWSRFVRTGDPNGPGLPPWPTYEANQNLCQILGETITSEPVPRNSKFDIFQKRLTARLASFVDDGEASAHP
jgi:para-nitrobenzyl esterase